MPARPFHPALDVLGILGNIQPRVETEALHSPPPFEVGDAPENIAELAAVAYRLRFVIAAQREDATLAVVVTFWNANGLCMPEQGIDEFKRVIQNRRTVTDFAG